MGKSIKQSTNYDNCYSQAARASLLAQGALNKYCRREGDRYYFDFAGRNGEQETVEIQLVENDVNDEKSQRDINNAVKALEKATLKRYESVTETVDANIKFRTPTGGCTDLGHSAQSFANDWGIPSIKKNISDLTFDGMEDLWDAGCAMTATKVCKKRDETKWFLHVYGIVDVSEDHVTVFEPYRVVQDSECSVCIHCNALPSAFKPVGSSLVGKSGSGTYRMTFTNFLKAFQADDDGYGGTVDIGLCNFTVQKRLPLKRKLSLTVQEDTTASIQVLQDRLLSRAESQWETQKAPKVLFTSCDKKGARSYKLLCPNRFGWGNGEHGGIRVLLKPDTTYSLELPNLNQAEAGSLDLTVVIATKNGEVAAE